MPICVYTVSSNLHLIVTSICIIKILLAVLFAGGSKRSGHFICYFVYPVRLLFYFNPFSEHNMPKPPAEGEEETFESGSRLRICYQEI